MSVHDLLAPDANEFQSPANDVFTRLLAPHRARIWAICRRIAGDDAGADDALAAALAEAWQRLDPDCDEQSFGPWLERIATRSSWEVIRRRWRMNLASRPGFQGADPIGPRLRVVQR